MLSQYICFLQWNTVWRHHVNAIFILAITVILTSLYMSVLLILITWIFILIRLRERRLGWREAFVYSWVLVWGVVILQTELFSLMTGLTRMNFLIGWCVAATLCFPWKQKACCRQIFGGWPVLSRGEWICLSFLGVILAMPLLFGFFIDPGISWDARSYHIPRVYHWISQASLAHFYTPDIRQTSLSPLLSYGFLHIRLLAGTDRLFYLVSWSSLVVCACTISLIAKSLKAGRFNQLLAACLSVLNPVLLPQASNALGDIFSSSFILLAVFLAFGIVGANTSWHITFLCGLVAGEAILGKGTAYIFAIATIPSLLILFCLCQHKVYKTALSGLLRHLVVIGLMVLLVNGGSYKRNWQEYGHILGGIDETVKVEAMSLHQTWSTFIRSVAWNMALPNGKWNHAVKETASRLGGHSGETWIDLPFGVGFETSTRIGNMVQLLMVLFLIPALFLRKNRRNRQVWLYFLCVLLYVGGICLALKWEYGLSRFFIPAFMILMALFATLVPRKWSLACMVVSALWVGFVFLDYIFPLQMLRSEQKNGITRMQTLKSFWWSSRIYHSYSIERRLKGNGLIYAEAMKWLPAKMASRDEIQAGMLRDQPYHYGYNESLIWLAAIASQNGEIPKMAHLWMDENAVPQARYRLPQVIFDERMDRTPAVKGYKRVLEHDVLSVWVQVLPEEST